MPIRWTLLLTLLSGCIARTAEVDEDSLDAAPADQAVTRIPDAQVPVDVQFDGESPSEPDAAAPEPFCEIEIEGGIIPVCHFPLNTRVACDEFARCVCEHDPNCVQGLVVPRGAITLADVCALAGTDLRTVGEVFENAALPTSSWRIIGTSELCAQLPAWTLWGETPSWSLRNARPPQRLEHPIDPDVLEDPILELNDVAQVWLADGRIELTDAAAARLRGLDLDALRGRDFLVGEHRGVIATWIRDGDGLPIGQPVASLDDLEATGQVRLRLDGSAFDLRPGVDGAHLAAADRVADLPCLGPSGCLSGLRCVDSMCGP